MMKILLLATILALHISTVTQAQPGPSTFPDRFDNLVRDDFFSGDPVKVRRVMKVCDERLATNSKYAPALAWKGAGHLFMAGMAFQTNDIQTGVEFWQAGQHEMDESVRLQPNSLQTRIPRGATYLGMANYDPNPVEKKHLIQLGVEDYETVLALQKSYFQTLSHHSKGELLSGLADGWFRLGNIEKSKSYWHRLEEDCPNSVYSQRAADWLKTSDPKILSQKSRKLTCIGCHGD